MVKAASTIKSRRPMSISSRLTDIRRSASVGRQAHTGTDQLDVIFTRQAATARRPIAQGSRHGGALAVIAYPSLVSRASTGREPSVLNVNAFSPGTPTSSPTQRTKTPSAVRSKVRTQLIDGISASAIGRDRADVPDKCRPSKGPPARWSMTRRHEAPNQCLAGAGDGKSATSAPPTWARRFQDLAMPHRKRRSCSSISAAVLRTFQKKNGTPP